MASRGEGENVSLDEMMERLKRSQSSSSKKESVGELVVREDGSKMLKVKRRKRRTKQPVHEQRKKKKLVKLIVFFSAFALSCLFVCAVAFLYIHYNSLAFTDDVKAQIKNASGAESDFVNLAVTPLSATADSVDFSWSENSILQSGKLSQVKAKLDTVKLFSGRLGSSEVTAAKGFFLLQFPSADIDAEESVNLSANVLDIPRLRLRYGSVSASGTLAKKFFIKDAEMGIDPKEDGLFVWTKGGGLQFGDFGAWDMQRAAFTFADKKTLEIEYLEAHQKDTEAKLFVEKNNVLTNERSVRLRANIEKLPLKMVFGESFAEIVGGYINTDELIIDFKKESKGAFDLKGKFSSGEVKLSRLPLLSSVRSVLRTSPKSDSLLNPKFTKNVEGEFEVQGKNKKVVFRNLNQPDQFALRGTLSSLSGGQLLGELSVGIPARFVEQLVESSAQDAFSRESDGYRWIDVKVSGSVKNPDDSLYDSLSHSGDPKKQFNGFVQPKNEKESVQDLERAFEDFTN